MGRNSLGLFIVSRHLTVHSHADQSDDTQKWQAIMNVRNGSVAACRFIPNGCVVNKLKHNLEIIGGIAVILSLLVVAYEIRQNTTALQATAMQESTTILREQVMILATNPELSRLMASKYDELDPDEQRRVRWSSRSFWFGRLLPGGRLFRFCRFLAG